MTSKPGWGADQLFGLKGNDSLTERCSAGVPARFSTTNVPSCSRMTWT